jgi:hypothetical protein
VGPAVRDEVAAADKEATDKRAAAKRAAQEAAVTKAAEERVTEEAAGATGAHRPPARRHQRPGPRGLRLQVAPPHRPNVPTRVFGNLDLSSSIPLFPYSFFCPHLYFLFSSNSFFIFFILLLSFLSRSSPSGVAAMTAGCRRCGCRGGSRSAPVSEPRTPEGVPEDVVESEGEPEVAPEAVSVVVQEAPTEGP